MKFCTAITGSGSEAIKLNGTARAINCDAEVLSGTGDGFQLNGDDIEITNCSVKLASTSANGVKAANFDAYITGLKVKGSANKFDLGTGTNVWTATEDDQGNSAQV